mmetsp:Transcript_143712/g.459897  ORF Transcript_143712/g.459897 Transcript_143712/m.459897 type:complete len:343 (+) Transcript_143712:486-1514(+)
MLDCNDASLVSCAERWLLIIGARAAGPARGDKHCWPRGDWPQAAAGVPPNMLPTPFDAMDSCRLSWCVWPWLSSKSPWKPFWRRRRAISLVVAMPSLLSQQARSLRLTSAASGSCTGFRGELRSKSCELPSTCLRSAAEATSSLFQWPLFRDAISVRGSKKEQFLEPRISSRWPRVSLRSPILQPNMSEKFFSPLRRAVPAGSSLWLSSEAMLRCATSEAGMVLCEDLLRLCWARSFTSGDAAGRPCRRESSFRWSWVSAMRSFEGVAVEEFNMRSLPKISDDIWWRLTSPADMPCVAFPFCLQFSFRVSCHCKFTDVCQNSFGMAALSWPLDLTTACASPS